MHAGDLQERLGHVDFAQLDERPAEPDPAGRVPYCQLVIAADAASIAAATLPGVSGIVSPCITHPAAVCLARIDPPRVFAAAIA